MHNWLIFSDPINFRANRVWDWIERWKAWDSSCWGCSLAYIVHSVCNIRNDAIAITMVCRLWLYQLYYRPGSGNFTQRREWIQQYFYKNGMNNAYNRYTTQVIKVISHNAISLSSVNWSLRSIHYYSISFMTSFDRMFKPYYMLCKIGLIIYHRLIKYNCILNPI